MNYLRAISTAVAVWIIGVHVFLVAIHLPISDDPELQANLALAIAFLPLAWFGAQYYYKTGSRTKGYQLAFIMALTAAVLDAIITVPLFFLPIGVTHSEFFGATGFWLLILEYTGIVILYDLIRRRKVMKRILDTTRHP